jgi:D-sedoheptulose 7-phosphate isomerase
MGSRQYQAGDKDMVQASGQTRKSLNDTTLSLGTRAIQFGELLSATAVTGRQGQALGLEDSLFTFCDWLTGLREAGRSLFILGNGGSATVASHAVTDFFNTARLRAITLHESSLLTCMTNDYGYENAFARMLGQMMQEGDALIAISSSGQSENIRNAARQAASNGGTVVTLSGFSDDNPLRSMGDLNFWLDSTDYGLVEVGHQFILHNLSDRLKNEFARQDRD